MKGRHKYGSFLLYDHTTPLHYPQPQTGYIDSSATPFLYSREDAYAQLMWTFIK